VLGRKANRYAMNPPRIRLIKRVIDEIVGRNDWQSLDAVLFPGGYFRSETFIGRLNFRGRASAIERQPFGEAAHAAAMKLQPHSPGALVVIGADAPDPTGNEAADHLCIAVGVTGVVGIARKIFLTDRDTRGNRWPITPDVRDYGASDRFVDLPNGARALLCACYDVFGIAERDTAPTIRTRAIRYLCSHGQYHEAGGRAFSELRQRCIVSWRENLDREKPAVALAAIHDFKRPGRESYWQRHGIAMASAALNGGLAIGAAHFRELLPEHGEAPLASVGVRRSHLTAGPNRRTEALLPINSFRLDMKGAPTVVVRLFSQ
jgi:hypothetical protein